jgi:hypothetical protein
MATQYSFSSKEWEGGLGGSSTLQLILKVIRIIGGHPILLQTYKQGKGNPNTQILIKVNYRGKLINVN